MYDHVLCRKKYDCTVEVYLSQVHKVKHLYIATIDPVDQFISCMLLSLFRFTDNSGERKWVAVEVVHSIFVEFCNSVGVNFLYTCSVDFPFDSKLREH